MSPAASIKKRIRALLEIKKGKKARIVFYIVYGFAVLGIFLYVRFPGGVVKNYLISRVSEYSPDVYLAIGAVRPGFPAGLELERLHLIFSGLSKEGIKAEKLSVRPDLSNILLGKSGLSVNMKAYDGKAEGDLLFGSLFSFSNPVQSRIHLDGVNVEKCAFLRDVLGRQISGILRGTLDYRGYCNRIIDGDGDVTVVLSNGSYPLLESVLGSDRIPFTNIELHVRLNKTILKIEKLNVNGTCLVCSLSGDVFLDEEMKKSRLDLKGDLETSGETRKKIPIFISGTLGNPRMKFI